MEGVVDLCIRVKGTGSGVIFLPDVEVFHLSGRAESQAPYLSTWHGRRGTIYHFLKHKGVISASVISLFLITAAAARAAAGCFLGVVNRKYRTMATQNVQLSRVLWNLLVRNPIGERRRQSSGSQSRQPVSLPEVATSSSNQLPVSAQKPPERMDL